MQPQGDSIWGNINLCIEIALNIYYLCGEKGEGIVIPKEQAEKDFSPETVAAGKESDGYLYYPKGEAMEMFRHEMLQKRLGTMMTCAYCNVIHIKNRCNIMRMHIVNKECHNAVMLTWIL